MIYNGDNVSIAAYCRISVDDELNKENTSIENQKAIIGDYINTNFPNALVDYYEDRDRSGYTFDQREQYQMMRVKLFRKEYDILIVKDLSRFSRRNSRGLVEIEDLRDIGIRIIAIGDSVDYPTNDDWFRIQIYFFLNEMPVTDTSKKVRNVIKRRQEDGKWVCNVPYGYVITNTKTMTYEVDPCQAVIVRKVFELYNKGWGYKKIANHLTDEGIPTPLMDAKARKEAKGDICKYKPKKEWSLVTISEIIENDFYIGTLRQGKYRRKKINGSEEKVADNEQIIFENHHEAIIDKRVFNIAQENKKKRTRADYKGIRKFTNAYSGMLYCGDCGHPMYPMSRRDLRESYHCGAYAKRGLKACTSHFIQVDTLDMIVKEVLKKARETSLTTIVHTERSIIEEEQNNVLEKSTLDNLKGMVSEITTEKKSLLRQRAIELNEDPMDVTGIRKMYDELIADAERRLMDLTNKINVMYGENEVITALTSATYGSSMLDRVLNKTRLQKSDLAPLVKRIDVYKDHVYVKLIMDINQ